MSAFERSISKRKPPAAFLEPPETCNEQAQV